MTIFVGNLPNSCTQDEVYQLFRQFGHIDMIKTPNNLQTISLEYWFVSYSDTSSYEIAIKNMNGYKFKNHILYVGSATYFNAEKFNLLKERLINHHDARHGANALYVKFEIPASLSTSSSSCLQDCLQEQENSSSFDVSVLCGIFKGILLFSCFLFLYFFIFKFYL